MKVLNALKSAIVLALLFSASAAQAQSTLSTVLTHYEAVRLSLFKDSMDGVADQGRKISDALESLATDWSPERAGIDADQAALAQELLPIMGTAADNLAEAKTLDEARDAFYDLSKPLVRLRGAAVDPMPVVAYCSMSKRSWLQPKGKIGNPYHGSAMPHCGQIVDG